MLDKCKGFGHALNNTANTYLVGHLDNLSGARRPDMENGFGVVGVDADRKLTTWFEATEQRLWAPMISLIPTRPKGS